MPLSSDFSMTSNQLLELNSELRAKTPLEIVRWAIDQADGRAIVSTNFRPYEAALLHLCAQAQPDIPVLWVDHGYNRSATYSHAALLKEMLHLNLQAFAPRMTVARYETLYGAVPALGDEEALKLFSAVCVSWRPRFGSPLCGRSKIRFARAWTSFRTMPTSGRSRSAPSSIILMRPWKPTSSSTICLMNGIISIRPRPTRNVSVGYMPPGA